MEERAKNEGRGEKKWAQYRPVKKVQTFQKILKLLESYTENKEYLQRSEKMSMYNCILSETIRNESEVKELQKKSLFKKNPQRCLPTIYFSTMRKCIFLRLYKIFTKVRHTIRTKETAPKCCQIRKNTLRRVEMQETVSE